MSGLIRFRIPHCDHRSASFVLPEQVDEHLGYRVITHPKLFQSLVLAVASICRHHFGENFASARAQTSEGRNPRAMAWRAKVSAVGLRSSCSINVTACRLRHARPDTSPKDSASSSRASFKTADKALQSSALMDGSTGTW